MNQKGFSKIILVITIVILSIAGFILIKRNTPTSPHSILNPIPQNSLPKTCVDEQEGTPVITYLSNYTGIMGTTVEVGGCNFSGFEGDKNVWIENSQGVKGIIYGEPDSTSKLIKIVLKSPLCQVDNSYSGLPCDAELALTPGTYKIYTYPWGKESNKVDFVIQ